MVRNMFTVFHNKVYNYRDLIMSLKEIFCILVVDIVMRIVILLFWGSDSFLERTT